MLKKLSNLKEYFITNLLTTFTIFVFAPIEFFIANSDDFFFSIFDVASLSIIFFTASFIFLCIFHMLIRLVNKTISKYLLVLQAAITISLYVQGNFLRTDYGELNGDAIDWSMYGSDSIISVLLWIIIIFSLLFLCKKKSSDSINKIITALSVWILLIQFIALASGLLTNGNLSPKEKTVTTADYQFEMAQNQNFIILLLDTFDSPTFFSVYNEQPAFYGDILEDFTYYRNTAGMYQYTSLSIPYIFSGEKYNDNYTFNGYIDAQYCNSPLLKRLTDEDYRIGIYSLNYMPQCELPYDVANLGSMNITVSSRKKLASFLYRLLAYRYAPFHLKQLFWFYPDSDDFIDYKTQNQEVFSDDNFIFYDKIDQMKKTDSQKAFFFYHLDGTHPPFDITDDFKRTGEETSIESETRGNMILVNTFLEKLKSTDSYDNSIIIIMGDHGYTNLRQSPVLMVKGLNEKKPFEISDIPVSYADCQDMFSALLDGSKCIDLFDEDIQKNKLREFYHYDFGKRGELIFEEFTIPEDAFNATP